MARRRVRESRIVWSVPKNVLRDSETSVRAPLPSPFDSAQGRLRERLCEGPCCGIAALLFLLFSHTMVLQTGPTKRIPLTVTRARCLRKNQTVTEMLLWRELRNRNLHGWKFRRQVPVGPFIVDFYCAEKKLIVELDGWVHEDRMIRMRDSRRQRYLEENGYLVLRFTNDDVNNTMMRVLRDITALQT